MGVAWGLVEYSERYDREEVITPWRALGIEASDHGFTVLHGEHRVHFGRRSRPDGPDESVVTVTHDPAARARVDALRTGDGTYDLFERLFDGYELFVPWRTPVKISAAGCSADGLRAASVLSLLQWMRAQVADHKRNPPEDPELARLATELYQAAKVARELNMLIRISF